VGAHVFSCTELPFPKREYRSFYLDAMELIVTPCSRNQDYQRPIAPMPSVKRARPRLSLRWRVGREVLRT